MLVYEAFAESAKSLKLLLKSPVTHSAPISNHDMISGIPKIKRDRERTTQELIHAAREPLQAASGQDFQIYDLSKLSGGGTG